MKRGTLPKRTRSTNPVVILKHVIQAIRDEPKRYDQSTFIERIDSAGTGPYPVSLKSFPRCGTICCVAGWVNQIAGDGNLAYEQQEFAAKTILGLDWIEAEDLFSVSAVPSRTSLGPRRHAQAGIKHIRQFVLKKWGKK